VTTAVAGVWVNKVDREPELLLRLFVSGLTPRSQRAVDNLQNLCERYLAGRYRIEVVDLYQSPGRARDEQIIATPTLVKVRPVPSRRVIGDLSQIDRVLLGLDIR
jgi:circadian clock protein KaiB